MKVIFLDLDGVLNIMSVNSGTDEYGEIFQTDFVQNLSNIIERTGAKIVLSSSWRMTGLKKVQDMWKDRNLPGEVIDVTPVLNINFQYKCLVRGEMKFHDEIGRGDEIAVWLDDKDVESYVIIDDVNDFSDEQQDNYICTSNNKDIDAINGVGLTKSLIELVVKILNK